MKWSGQSKALQKMKESSALSKHSKRPFKKRIACRWMTRFKHTDLLVECSFIFQWSLFCLSVRFTLWSLSRHIRGVLGLRTPGGSGGIQQQHFLQPHAQTESVSHHTSGTAQHRGRHLTFECIKRHTDLHLHLSSLRALLVLSSESTCIVTLCIALKFNVTSDNIRIYAHQIK